MRNLGLVQPRPVVDIVMITKCIERDTWSVLCGAGVDTLLENMIDGLGTTLNTTQSESPQYRLGYHDLMSRLFRKMKMLGIFETSNVIFSQ